LRASREIGEGHVQITANPSHVPCFSVGPVATELANDTAVRPDRFRDEEAAADFGIWAGTVNPGPVEETVPTRLLGTSALQHLSRQSPGGTRTPGAAPGDQVVNRSIYNTESTPSGS
jgi:hypothetical protein